MPFFLSEYQVECLPHHINIKRIHRKLTKYENKVFVVWGYQSSPTLEPYAEKYQIPLYRLEDGFIRSVGLGSLRNPPFSLCLDKTGMYFDARRPSDLEVILNEYDFQANPTIIKRANACLKLINEHQISKYNHVQTQDIHNVYGKKTKKRVLVVGQVEDDQSIQKGCAKPITNNDLVRMAFQENQDAEIIYKPHPDVLVGKREKYSDPNDVKDIAKVIEVPLSLNDACKTIDHVYTITSLSGFEALLKGIKVTTVGAPFYSGWGLTDDRQPVPRRMRSLSLLELLAGAYLLYPRYANPETGEPLDLEDVLQLIIDQKDDDSISV
ncbi:hypothetical protein AB990_02650 [Alkalihalobacillus pseudalcaliphilus]|nr:hypothetical protein AB990_02650 [Alkalihalobacillus pseudalcaliphilus]